MVESNGKKKQVEEGRNQLGQFTKGSRLPAEFRKKMPDVRPLLRYLDESYPPTRIVEELEKIFAAKNNFKVKLEALKWLHDVQYGKPISRQVSANLDVQEFASLFQDPEDDGPDDDDVIDIEGRVT